MDSMASTLKALGDLKMQTASLDVFSKAASSMFPDIEDLYERREQYAQKLMDKGKSPEQAARVAKLLYS